MRSGKEMRKFSYLFEEGVHPFCEGFLLDVDALLLQNLDASLLKFLCGILLGHFASFSS